MMAIDGALTQGFGAGGKAPPVVCVVGKKKSGKTTFLEKLIPELARRGLRVGTVKHDTHGFDMDTPGKDTWRHRQAGAAAVAIASPWRLAYIAELETEPSLDELAAGLLGHVDIVLTEGYASSDKPKIEVFRTEEHSGPLDPPPGCLLAMVSDSAGPFLVPVFGLDQVAAVADLLQARGLVRS